MATMLKQPIGRTYHSDNITPIATATNTAGTPMLKATAAARSQTMCMRACGVQAGCCTCVSPRSTKGGPMP